MIKWKSCLESTYKELKLQEKSRNRISKGSLESTYKELKLELDKGNYGYKRQFRVYL